jgi:DNA-binding CsgD family transcriptional regulator
MVVMPDGSHAFELTSNLSPRETQVLDMASLGMRNAEIAERLGLSVHAIKFHLAAVYRKLGVSNRTEAVVAYVRRNEARPSAAGGVST